MAQITRSQAQNLINDAFSEYISLLEKAKKRKASLHPDGQLLLAELKNLQNYRYHNILNGCVFDRLNIKGIRQLFMGFELLAKTYKLPSESRMKDSTIVEDSALFYFIPSVTGTSPFTGHTIEKGRRITFKLVKPSGYERKPRTFHTIQWNRYRMRKGKPIKENILNDSLKDFMDDDSWDRPFQFIDPGTYKICADIILEEQDGSKRLLDHHEYDVTVQEPENSYVTSLSEIEKIARAISFSDFSKQIPNLMIVAGFVLASVGVLAALKYFKIDWIVKILTPILRAVGYAGDILDVTKALSLLYDFYLLAVNAQSEEALRDAGAVFAEAAAMIGMALLFKILEKLPSANSTDDVNITDSKKTEYVQSLMDNNPGSPAHKAIRWEQYKEIGGEWNYERWSKTYENNMLRATKANKAVDQYHETINWGKREVTVEISLDNKEVLRRLDIADINLQQGIEHKTGYICANKEVIWEVTRDSELVKNGWDITWIIEGRISEPLEKILLKNHIKLIRR